MDGQGKVIKKVKLVYNDGQKVTIKYCDLLEADSEFVKIRCNGINETIPTQRVVRWEEIQ